jgi:hypothetical protein
LVSDFSEETAYNYLNWGYDSQKRNGRLLQEALGDDYATKHQAFFLPSVDSEQIDNVAPLSSGANGIVYSAKWARCHPTDLNDQKEISVVLKQPKHTEGKHNWEKKIVDEVSSVATFLINLR